MMYALKYSVISSCDSKSEEQKKGPKLFTWATMVPLVGREVELYGEVYPGYAGIKGIHIESIRFEGLYIVGQSEDSV